MTKILVVEDESIIARDIEATLEDMGYDVVGIASSGEEAVKKTEELKPDIVLMDIVLRGEMDGIEAAKLIRSRYKIPIVYVTAYTDEKTLQRAKVTEPFGYVVKPFEERDLQVAIEIALYKHEMEKKLEESERRFRELVYYLPEIVFETDSDGKITYANYAMFEKTKYSKEDFEKGISLLDLIAPKDRSRIVEDIKRIVKGEKLKGIKYNILRKDGTTFPSLIHISPISSGKNLIMLRGVIVDLSEEIDEKAKKLMIKRLKVLKSYIEE